MAQILKHLFVLHCGLKKARGCLKGQMDFSKAMPGEYSFESSWHLKKGLLARIYCPLTLVFN